MDYFEPMASDSLYKLAKRSLVGYVGAEDSCTRACSDFAVLELCAERPVRLAGEGDCVGAL